MGAMGAQAAVAIGFMIKLGDRKFRNGVLAKMDLTKGIKNMVNPSNGNERREQRRFALGILTYSAVIMSLEGKNKADASGQLIIATYLVSSRVRRVSRKAQTLKFGSSKRSTDNTLKDLRIIEPVLAFYATNLSGYKPPPDRYPCTSPNSCSTPDDPINPDNLNDKPEQTDTPIPCRWDSNKNEFVACDPYRR
jgi:hypothetical protein